MKNQIQRFREVCEGECAQFTDTYTPPGIHHINLGFEEVGYVIKCDVSEVWVPVCRGDWVFYYDNGAVDVVDDATFKSSQGNYGGILEIGDEV